MPSAIRNSKILSGNNLGQLANVHDMPIVNSNFENDTLKQIVQYYNLNPQDMEVETHKLAVKLLADNNVDDAWQVLLANDVM